MVAEGKREGGGRRDGEQKGLFSGLIQGTSLFIIWLCRIRGGGVGTNRDDDKK
jgi:hypothetical protein